MQGLGLLVGPIVGSQFYVAFGLQDCFLVVGAVIITVAILFAIYFPQAEVKDSLLTELHGMSSEDSENAVTPRYGDVEEG